MESAKAQCNNKIKWNNENNRSKQKLIIATCNDWLKTKYAVHSGYWLALTNKGIKHDKAVEKEKAWSNEVGHDHHADVEKMKTQFKTTTKNKAAMHQRSTSLWESQWMQN